MYSTQRYCPAHRRSATSSVPTSKPSSMAHESSACPPSRARLKRAACSRSCQAAKTLNPSHSSSPHVAATIVEIAVTVEIAAIVATAQHAVQTVIAQRAPMAIVVPVAKARHLLGPVPEPVQIVVLAVMVIAPLAPVAKPVQATVVLAPTSLPRPSWRSVRSQSASSQAALTALRCSPICQRPNAPWPSVPCRVEFLRCVKPFKSKTPASRPQAKKRFQPPV